MDFTATKVFFNRNIIFLKNFIKEKESIRADHWKGFADNFLTL